METEIQTLNRLWKRVQDCRDNAEIFSQAGQDMIANYYRWSKQSALTEIRRICHAALTPPFSIG